mgnify:CR=1 FL=1
MSTACPGASSGGRGRGAQLRDDAVLGHHRPQEVRSAHELRRRTGCRAGGRLERRGDLLEPARVQNPDAIRQRERLLLVVGHEDGRRSWSARRILPISSRIAARRSASRFENGSSEQDERRGRRERAGERDALLLAARELVRIYARRDRRDRPARALRGRGAPAAARGEVREPEAHVGLDRQVRKQGVVLEDHAHAA